LIKGDGGAVCLTENPTQLLRLMLCGPEIARLVHEFEDLTITPTAENSFFKHNEQTTAFVVEGLESMTSNQVTSLALVRSPGDVLVV
jgi:hypothetical protein